MAPERCLGPDEKASKITMTLWISAIREHMEEHGLDAVFRI
jgi:hypothetical protein